MRPHVAVAHILTMLPLAASVALPPHARVNSHCYTRWNTARSDLEVVWNQQVYRHPFHHFSVQPSNNEICTERDGVQRLFCTNNGVVGWYGRIRHARPGSARMLANVTWIQNTQLQHWEYLIARLDSDTLRDSSEASHGTVTVLGNTLYFLARDAWYHTCPPRLNSLVFSEYREGVAASDLVHWGLRGVSVFGPILNEYWDRQCTQIYPAGTDAITFSTVDNMTTVIDFVVSTSGIVEATVHWKPPTISNATRQAISTHGLTCISHNTKGVHCYQLGTERVSWLQSAQEALGLYFEPIDPGRMFELPQSLWLLGLTVRNAAAITPLVGAGHAPLLGLAGDAVVAVESRPDMACASGRRLFRVEHALPGAEELRTEALNCEWRQVAPAPLDFEPAYGALIVKWAGAWADGPMFTAVDLDESQYHQRGAPEEPWEGDASTEHVAFGSTYSAIRLASGRPITCPAIKEQGLVPRDPAVAAGSADMGDMVCVDRLVQAGRVMPDEYFDGCPLLAWVHDECGVDHLLGAGADANAMCANGSTPLRQALERRSNAVSRLLDAGAAVCTRPLNALGVGDPDESARVDAVRLTAPCEPGFWLAEAPGCTGLTPCPAGSYCPGYRERTNRALPCPAGTYGPEIGASTAVQCRPCPQDRPQSAPGSVSIDECEQSLLIGELKEPKHSEKLHQ